MHIVMPSLCLVCNATCDGKLRNGIVACQAWKSFFLRSQPSGADLKCLTSLNNCSAVTNLKYTADGRRLRFSCPKCRFRRCQEVGMKSPKTSMGSEEARDSDSILPNITTGTSTKETVNSLIQVFMDINSATASTIPGLVQDWNPQSTSQDVAQCFISNSDQASRLFSNFLKANPIYKRLTMADRCSTFFQCAIRLRRIFKAAPAAMSRNNFHRLQTLFPDFQVLFCFAYFSNYFFVDSWKGLYREPSGGSTVPIQHLRTCFLGQFALLS